MEFLKSIWVLNGVLAGILVCMGLTGSIVLALYTILKGGKND